MTVRESRRARLLRDRPKGAPSSMERLGRLTGGGCAVAAYSLRQFRPLRRIPKNVNHTDDESMVNE